MEALLQDLQQPETFVEKVRQPYRKHSSSLELCLMEWYHGVQQAIFRTVTCAEDIDDGRANCAIRIIFAPLDVANPFTWRGSLAVLEFLSVPSAYLTERNQHVVSAFGNQACADGAHKLWFHFLCKDLEAWSQAMLEEQESATLSWTDGIWQRAGFFMAWQHKEDAASDKQGHSAPLTLCCWGVTEALQCRIAYLTEAPSWVEILDDPFVLLAVILEELSGLIRSQIKSLSMVLGQIETQTLTASQGDLRGLGRFDFVGLSNLSKHIIHVREACDAILETTSWIQRTHEKHFQRNLSRRNSTNVSIIEDALEHKWSLFNSSRLQINSLEKRTSNLTNLAFNLVNQRNSLVAIDDSRSMKMIAIVTLTFLPFASVAALFSTPFFSSTDKPTKMMVSSDFWIFWITVVPLSILVFVSSTLAYKYSVQRTRSI